ncbi:MAG: ATP-dependent RNA helicase [Deltaproteobacteria bacterium]|nr:ATP-dependent RNA helicase [Deltaproteobacteria bacterium]
MSESFPRSPTARACALPIYAAHDALIDAIRSHQVTVVVGPTGCGKTTQLPQMLLRAGLTDKVIGVTQPRRLAAVSVAWRVAEEQGVTCGAEVGYCIRFDDLSGPDTRLRIMTDGILLQEARSDPHWSRYGVLVIDEAHERSLNIDFTLGLLHEALRFRPDLRVVVSSATLQPQKFVEFFGDVCPHVPVVSIEARPYPVQKIWQPLDDGSPEALAEAVAQQVARAHKADPTGHVLVFLSGEDAIKRAMAALQQRGFDRSTAILPLYGAMQREEQERVFADLGKRKVVLATNIAETSLTIDGVTTVIDSGLAKVPRFVPRAGLSLLREEGISRASADQRLGRAGRTAPGRCIRLYSERDYSQRPAFTDEEIVRLDLAETVLSLIDLGVHDIERFALPTRPPRGRLVAAVQSLQQLGAIDDRRTLTPIGKKMVPFPLSPTLARLVVEAGMCAPDVGDDACILAAYSSSRAPQLYPAGQEDRARRAHARWSDPLGDAVAAVKVFRAWEKSNDREWFCHQNYLDGAILAFVAKARAQLVDIATSLGMRIGAHGDSQDLARCVAVAYAANAMANRGRQFESATGERVFLHPGSVLYGSPPRFAVASEIVVSQRTYARQVTAVRPAWLAELRPDLAARWQLRPDKVRKDEGPPPATPKILQLGPVVLQVEGGKGRPRVDLGLEDARAVAVAGPQPLPDGAQRWQARIVVGDLALASGTPLGALLALLPVLPLPEQGADLRCAVPEGALLEVDRGRHALLRHLPSLLVPMAQHTGRRAGWAALVHNGDDGYWYEVMPDFRDAVETTAAALGQLGNQVDDPQVAVAEARVDALRDRMQAALAGRSFRQA